MFRTVKVDDDRYIEIENNLQRRYDDPSKFRYVKRLGPLVVLTFSIFLTTQIRN